MDYDATALTVNPISDSGSPDINTFKLFGSGNILTNGTIGYMDAVATCDSKYNKIQYNK